MEIKIQIKMCKDNNTIESLKELLKKLTDEKYIKIVKDKIKVLENNEIVTK
jgi:hypothetical protein